MDSRAVLPSNYQALSKNQKVNLLWKNILNTAYPPHHLPNRRKSLVNLIKIIARIIQIHRFTSQTFSAPSDQAPENHEKILHIYGSVAQVKYESIGDHPYTGLFRENTLALLRASLAGPVAPDKHSPFLPGVAVKFLIEGKPSLNLTLLHSFDDEGPNYNFFSYQVSNIIPTPKNLIFKLLGNYLTMRLRNYFSDPHLSFFHLNLMAFAQRDSSGNEVDDACAPYQIIFVSSMQLDNAPSPDFRSKLAQIKPLTEIYQIYAKQTKQAEKKLIGRIVTESEFIASSYGDKVLFFQHSR